MPIMQLHIFLAHSTSISTGHHKIIIKIIKIVALKIAKRIIIIIIKKVLFGSVTSEHSNNIQKHSEVFRNVL